MLFDIFYSNLIILFFFLCLLFLAPGVGLLFFISSFFLFGWTGGRNWCGPLGVWNNDIFLSPHRHHCFIQGIWFIVLSFTWMWPCCLRRRGFLVGASPTQRALAFPLFGFQKKSIICYLMFIINSDQNYGIFITYL